MNTLAKLRQNQTAWHKKIMGKVRHFAGAFEHAEHTGFRSLQRKADAAEASLNDELTLSPAITELNAVADLLATLRGLVHDDTKPLRNRLQSIDSHIWLTLQKWNGHTPDDPPVPDKQYVTVPVQPEEWRIQSLRRQIVNQLEWEAEVLVTAGEYFAFDPSQSSLGSPESHKKYLLASFEKAMRECPWKQAVIDKHVINHTLKAEHETDPDKAINDLLSYESQIALDPKVSTAAAQLIAHAQRTGLVAAANIADEYARAHPYARVAGQTIANKIRDKGFGQ